MAGGLNKAEILCPGDGMQGDRKVLKMSFSKADLVIETKILVVQRVPVCPHRPRDTWQVFETICIARQFRSPGHLKRNA